MDLAVIGAGYWGKNIVRVFSELGALACICETDKSRISELKKQYNTTNKDDINNIIGPLKTKLVSPYDSNTRIIGKYQ